MERGRDQYLAQNGFGLAGYDEAVSHVNYMGIHVPIPNTPKRRWALRLHDLHHVATGFGTDPIGEAEISAWELRSGLYVLGPYVGAIVLSAAAAGGVLGPVRTLAAWRAAAYARSLFGMSHVDYSKLLKLEIGQLRGMLGVPMHGLARHRPGSHASAPVHARA